MYVCYLSQGAYSGTFHDAAQEEQVDVFGARGGGKLIQIIQHLLHGWGETKTEERERDKKS